MRLTGVPSGKLCSIDAFLRCMPVPDADLMRFAAGTSSEIRLQEADFAVENLADRTRRWVRRRAEVEVDEQGNAWRMIGTLEDMTRDRIATNRLSAMVMLGDALREVGTPLDAYRAAASALGDALGADRAGVPSSKAMMRRNSGSRRIGTERSRRVRWVFMTVQSTRRR
ncbi:hypothetical protein [Asaia astilbis]|uniref:hypothetical protein n=1 Tax=Asaia astilbis TaxID=610244 RepID=UPI00047261D9|nr:hypothetical protein [Asaia astilbis]